MSELNKFKSELQANNKLQKKMEAASTIKDVVDIASSAGFNVSENELRDDLVAAVSGGDVGSAGLGLGGLLGSNGDISIGDVNANADVSASLNLLDFSSMTANINQHLEGATNSNAVQSGSINVSKGR